MSPKYQILKNDYVDIRHPESKKNEIVRLYRIIAMKDFVIQGYVKVTNGSIGGYVQSEKNLPQDDNSWIFHIAKVFDDAVITGESFLQDNAAAYGKAIIRGNSVLKDNARVRGNSSIVDGIISHNSDVKGNAIVVSSNVMNAAMVYEDGFVSESSLADGAMVHGTSKVIKSVLSDVSEVRGSATVTNCRLGGRTVIDSGDHVNDTVIREIELSVESGKGER